MHAVEPQVTVYDTLDACVDCLFFVSYGDVPEEREDIDADIEARWPSREGFYLCPGNNADGSGFSTSPCGCCGSRLGGERYDIHVLTTRPAPAVR